MRLKKDSIGSVHYIKSLDTNIVIEDNSEKHELYKLFNLDVFEQEEKKYKGKNDSNN